MDKKWYCGWYLDDGVPIDVCVYEKNAEKESTISLHSHGFYEMEFIVDGDIVNTVNGTASHAGRGDLFLLSIGDSHRLDIHSKTARILKLNFIRGAFPADMEKVIETLPLPLSQHYSGDEFDMMLAELNKVAFAARQAEKGDEIARLTLRVTAETLLCRVLKNVPSSKLLPRMPEVVRDGMAYIKENLSEPLRLTELAKKLCLSPGHFSHVFREYTSLSPKAYLRDCRMRAARELLVCTDIPVARIAEQVGYASPSLFYRHIETYYGKKPLTLRKTLKRDADNFHREP